MLILASAVDESDKGMFAFTFAQRFARDSTRRVSGLARSFVRSLAFGFFDATLNERTGGRNRDDGCCASARRRTTLCRHVNFWHRSYMQTTPLEPKRIWLLSRFRGTKGPRKQRLQEWPNVGRDYFAVAVIPREKPSDWPTRQRSHEVVVNQLQRHVANYVIVRTQCRRV